MNSSVIAEIVLTLSFPALLFGGGYYMYSIRSIYEYKVTCEDPYYKGTAKRAYMTDGGNTHIVSENGTVYKYSSDVKCEIIRKEQSSK